MATFIESHIIADPAPQMITRPTALAKPNKGRIIAATYDNIWFLDMDTEMWTKGPKINYPSYVKSIKYSPDDTKLLITYCMGFMCRVIGPNEPEFGSPLYYPHGTVDGFSTLGEWSPDGKSIAIGTSRGQLFLYTLTDNERFVATSEWKRTSENASVECITWSPDGRFIACGGDLSNFSVWPTSAFDSQTKTTPEETETAQLITTLLCELLRTVCRGVIACIWVNTKIVFTCFGKDYLYWIDTATLHEYVGKTAKEKVSLFQGSSVVFLGHTGFTNKFGQLIAKDDTVTMVEDYNRTAAIVNIQTKQATHPRNSKYIDRGTTFACSPTQLLTACQSIGRVGLYMNTLFAWSDRTHTRAPPKFRQIVFHLMCIRTRMHSTHNRISDLKHRRSSRLLLKHNPFIALPKLPIEMWLNILMFLSFHVDCDK